MTKDAQVYVDKIGIMRWGWEARQDGFHVDAGFAWTRRGAERKAKEALARVAA